MVADYGNVENQKTGQSLCQTSPASLQMQNPHRSPDHNPRKSMKPKKQKSASKPLTHAEFSARGGKANTPAQNAARAANSKKAAQAKTALDAFFISTNFKPAKREDEK